MSRIEIEVLKSQAALKAFSNTWEKLESGRLATPRLAFGSLRELFSAITPKRLELVRFVAGHEGLNTRQLASRIRRNYKNVHGDVKELTELGLLEKDEAGLLFAPYDEIVIHAPIREVA